MQREPFLPCHTGEISSALNSSQFEDRLDRDGPRTLFIIDCESGRDIRRHSFFPSTDELLLMAAS